jgi:hypothetical protein
MSSKYTRHRPTLPFTTIFGTFAVKERSPLYKRLLVSAGLLDNNKQAVLAFLFHLGCFEIDKQWGEVSFRGDIDSHAVLLSSHFPVALQLVGLHNDHVSRSKSNLKEKARAKQALCHEKNERI